ncbi:MAG: flagellar biosynthetic protein FliR [Phycisphaerales bacterium]|jgi:flagellar biosynthetic protein FliR
MVSLEPYIAHLIPFSLVLSRVVGLFLFTPMLSGTSLPRQIRVVLALTFAVAVYPMVPPQQFPTEMGLMGLAPMLISEALVGVVIGLIALIPLAALQMGGYIMGHQMGLAMARSYNPEMGAESSALGQLMFYLGAMIFLSIGGLDLVFLALATTFTTLPMGGLTSTAAPLDAIVRLLGAAFEFAMRISMPVSAVVGMLLIAIGFIMKTMPQINVMSIGFAIKIIAGLSATSAMLYVLQDVSAIEIQRVLDIMLEWARDPMGTATDPLITDAVGLGTGAGVAGG